MKLKASPSTRLLVLACAGFPGLQLAACTEDASQVLADPPAVQGTEHALKGAAYAEPILFDDTLSAGSKVALDPNFDVDPKQPIIGQVDSKDSEAAALLVSPRVIVEDPGTFIAVSGTECVEVAGGSANLPALWSTPDYVDDATVFLNGFHLSYVKDDQHVQSQGATIHTARFLPSYHVLTWRATLAFRDAGRDETVRLCYDYTALGWNRERIDLRVADQAGHEELTFRDAAPSHTLEFEIESPYGPKDTVAILPRGFMQSYTGPDVWYHTSLEGFLNTIGLHYWGYDHHVLQSAFLWGQDNDAGSGVRWEAKSVFHDNNGDDATAAGAHAVVLGGTSLSIELPDFSIRPRDASNSCILPGEPQGQNLTHVRVDKLGYDYVVPVLTGFALGYHCDDEHVAQIGSQLQNARYNRLTGTLDYDMVESFADEDQDPAFDAAHQVMLLGIRRTDRVSITQPVLDRLAQDP